MPLRALVADSDPTTCGQIAALLTREGHAVETSDHGERAFARFLASMSDLVIVDDALPGMRAGELCQQIRDLSSRVRIILLSGGSSEASEHQRLRDDTRCDAILDRPLRLERLTGILADWGMAGAESPLADATGLTFGVPMEGAHDSDGGMVPGGLAATLSALSTMVAPVGPDEVADAVPAEAVPSSPFELVPLATLPPPAPIPVAAPAPPLFAPPTEPPAPESPPPSTPPPSTPIAIPESQPPATATPTTPPAPPIQVPEPEALPPITIPDERQVTPISSPAPQATTRITLPDQPPVRERAAPEPQPPPPTEESGPQPAPFPVAPEPQPLPFPVAPLPQPAPPVAGPEAQPPAALAEPPPAAPTAEPAAGAEPPPAAPTAEPIPQPPAALAEPPPAAPTAEPVPQPPAALAEPPPAVPTAEPVPQPPPPTVAAAPQPAAGMDPGEPEITPPSEEDLPEPPAGPNQVPGAPGSIAARTAIAEPDPVAAIALHGADTRASTAPSTLLPSGVSRFGDLASMPFPRLLYELYIGAYFGVLHLEREGARRTVYFWAGAPVRVDTDQLSDSLGAILRAENRITDAQLEEAKEFSRTNDTPIGASLVRTGALHERDLLEALTRQTEHKLVSTFAWRNGRYVARDDTTFVNDTMLNDVRPLEIIWRGVCEHYEVGSLLNFFSNHRSRYILPSDLYPVQALAFIEHLREFKLTKLLNGRTTFEEALVSEPARTVELARALYVLMVTDTIKPSDQPGDPAPELAIAEEASPALVDYDALLSASERIAREYVRVSGRDAFAVLQLEHDADTNTIEEIYRAATARMEEDRVRPGLAPEDGKRAVEVARIYAEAYETLIDPTRREVYVHALAASPAPAPSAPPEFAQDRRGALFDAEQAYNEGMALMAVSEARAAREKFQTAVEIHPDEAAYRVAMAQAILAGGTDPGESGPAVAFGLIEEALRLDPSSLPANLEAARLLIDGDMPESARHYLERVLRRAPDHSIARKMLREL